MKYVILSLLTFILSVLTINAQITITAENVPDPGTNFIKGIDDMPTGIDPGVPGPGQTWDFTSLETDETLGYSYIHPLSTPFSSYFPEANLALQSVDTAYSYLTFDPDSYELLGVVVEYESEEYVFDYEPDMLVMEFPFAYGSQFTQDYAFEWILASGEDSLRFKNSVNRSVEADAFGTVMLPVGSYEALRVTTTQVSKDSTWAQVLGNWTLIASTISTLNYYDFYTNDQEVDILVASLSYDENWSTLESAEFFRDSFVDVDDDEIQAGTRIYPNPASDLLVIESEITGGTVQIINLAGQVIIERNLEKQKLGIDLGSLQKGVYFVRLFNALSENVYSDKVVIR